MNPLPIAVLSRQEVEAILEPWLPMLREKFHEAWGWVQDDLNEKPDRRATFDSSTVSAMIYDRFKRIILPEFDGKPGVKIERRGRMIRIRIDNKVCLRFKRLDRKLRSGNIRTRSQKAIYHQQPYLIDVVDRATALTFGYVPDASKSDVRGLYVTCPKNFRENHYMIVLDDQSDATSLLPTAPLPPTLPLPSVVPTIKPAKTEG